MIKDTILQNQSLDIKISDIAFEITHKLLLDPKFSLVFRNKNRKK